MLRETIEKRITNAINRYIPDESLNVKNYIAEIIFNTYKGLRINPELDDNGKPYSESRDLHFAISITLDDVDTPLILKEAREKTKDN